MSTDLPLSPEQLLAIEKFLYTCTVPIFNGDKPKPYMHGTGVLAEFFGQVYLVSAAHVINVQKPELLGVPVNGRNAETTTLGEGMAATPGDTDRYDVGAYRIENTDVIGKLRASWTFLSEENLPLDNEWFDLFLVAGYPDSQTTVRGKNISAKAIQQIYTTKYDGKVDEPVDEFDLLLKYGDKVATRAGQIIRTPQLHGISGAAVWGVRTLGSTEVWTPEKALAMIGVQYAFHHRKYIRAKSWEVVHELLSKVRDRKGPESGSR